MVKFKIWENSFPDFESASKHKVGPGFSGSVYLERSLQAAEECLQALKSGQQIPYFHKQRNMHLPIIVSMMLSKKTNKIRILDFGGGLGVAYMTLIESIPKLMDRVEYHILEIPEICEIGKNLFVSDSNIAFSSTFPNEENIDLIYSSSSIQYVQAWDKLIQNFCELGPSFILISDAIIGAEQSFVSLQNYYESKICTWYLNMNDLLSEFLNYNLILSIKMNTQVGLGLDLSLSQDELSKKFLDTSSLLFSKNIDDTYNE